MPVSNKTSSNADVVTSSKTGKDPKGLKDQTTSSDISEDMIKEAIEKRGSYFRKNSEYVSSTSRCMYNYRKFMLTSMAAMCWFIELLNLCTLIYMRHGDKKMTLTDTPSKVLSLCYISSSTMEKLMINFASWR